MCFASSWCQILEIYFKKKKKILKIPSWPSYSHKLYIWSRLAIKSRKTTTTKCVLSVWLNKKFLFTSKRGCTHIQCDLYFPFYWKRWIFVFLFWKLPFSRWEKNDIFSSAWQLLLSFYSLPKNEIKRSQTPSIQEKCLKKPPRVFFFHKKYFEFKEALSFTHGQNTYLIIFTKYYLFRLTFQWQFKFC